MASEISNRLKAVIKLSGHTQKEFAAYLGITAQALQNKMSRGSFSADDLIKLSLFTGNELSFGNGAIKLDADCLRQKADSE